MKKLLYTLCVITIIGIEFQDQITFFSPSINRMFGIVMTCIMLLVWRNATIFTRVLSTEICLWAIFVIYVSCASFFVAKNQNAFFDMFTYLIQLTALICCIVTIVIEQKDVNGVLLINIILFFVFILYLVFSNRWNWILYMGDNQSHKLGDINNPNGLGFMFLNAVMSLFIISPNEGKIKRLILQLLRIAMIIFGCFMILQTGSRKTAIALLVFILTWLVFCKFRGNDNPVKALGIFLFSVSFGLLFVYIAIPYILDNTYFGIRFRALQTGNDASALTRQLLYREAVAFFSDSPLIGIGLDQFRYHSVTGLYAHSDYAEVLADTGLIGCFLYFSIYFLLGYKLLGIRKNNPKKSAVWYTAGCLLSMMIARLVINFGAVGFTTISNWLVMTPIIGFASLYNTREKTSLPTKGELTK